MNCGTKVYTENIEAPKSRATRLVVHTAPWRIIRMSMTGFAERDSAVTQTLNSTATAANMTMVAGDAQPQVWPSLSGSSRATSQTASSADAAQLMRPPERTGD